LLCDLTSHQPDSDDYLRGKALSTFPIDGLIAVPTSPRNISNVRNASVDSQFGCILTILMFLIFQSSRPAGLPDGSHAFAYMAKRRCRGAKMGRTRLTRKGRVVTLRMRCPSGRARINRPACHRSAAPGRTPVSVSVHCAGFTDDSDVSDLPKAHTSVGFPTAQMRLLILGRLSKRVDED
jgi:hypothetical protein